MEKHKKLSNGPSQIYVDIDETICFYPDGDRIYENAVPNYSFIEKINHLYDSGNIITYWTARGSSKPNDIFRYSYIENLTRDQLNKWGCKYHLLKIGKPGYDILIDDKTKRIEEI